MKLSDLRPGDKIRPTRNWGCLGTKMIRVVRKDADGLFVRCSEGHHYLDGQTGELSDPDELVGLEKL